MVDWEKFSKGFLRDWFAGLMDSLETQVDEETRAKVLQYCGRVCARAHAVELFERLKASTTNLNEFFEKLNQQIKGTTWQLVDNNTISVEYEKCFCPLAATGLVESATRCYCSTGWVKENLELILEKPVEVTLENSVAKGDPVCRFTVRF